MRQAGAAVNGFWTHFPAGGRSGTDLCFIFDAFSLREPATTSLENAINKVEQGSPVTP
jgi:hypothetical protein